MRAHTTPTKMVSPRIRRIAMSFAAAVFASFSMMSSESQLQAAGPGDVEIVYFNAIPMGFDEWFVDGIVESSEMSSVTVTLGGAATSVGTITPDEYGIFFFELVALPYDYVTADATDGTATDTADVTLHDYF